MKTSCLAAYIPVIHQGYVQWFDRHSDVRSLVLLDSQLVPDYRPLIKDLRAISSEQLVPMLQSLARFDQIVVATPANWPQCLQSFEQILSPDEDISRQVLEPRTQQQRITFEPFFLRWDRVQTQLERAPLPDEVVSQSVFDRQIMGQAQQVAEQSSDWWRQVGAALVMDGRVKLVVRNRHLPQDQQHYVDGDPRALFQSGEEIELTSSMHAEAELVAQAARRGWAIEGADVYCTTFPCPVCAKLLARAGVGRVFYQTGYSLLDGHEVMKAAGIKMIRVEAESSPA